jgi:hypothetical protein
LDGNAGVSSPGQRAQTWQVLLLTYCYDPVEDYPNGYPRFSALMAAHDSFLVARRFSQLRTRLLLLSQDRVAELEERLDKIDRDEARTMYLGSRRRDRNEERLSIIADLHEALKTYGERATG